ncbi:MAG: polymorphic toxin-type HINT domain-containing protein [Planctomycetia bacterium]
MAEEPGAVPEDLAQALADLLKPEPTNPSSLLLPKSLTPAVDPNDVVDVDEVRPWAEFVLSSAANAVDFGVNFTRGAGQGFVGQIMDVPGDLYETGKSAVYGVGTALWIVGHDVGQTLWYWSPSKTYVASGFHIAGTALGEAAYAAPEAAARAAQITSDFEAIFSDPALRSAILRGDYGALTGRVSPETQLLFAAMGDAVRDVLDEAYKEWSHLKPKEIGFYAGQLVGAMAAEVAVGVAMSAASAGAGAAAKAINLPRKLEKLADKSEVFKFLLNARVMNKLKAANARLAHLLGTALCFAAGTPVHTADGLRPIESIQPGDLVWTRRDDGPADAPLVLRQVEAALVTDSSALLRLTYRTADGDEETLATTPNHPFYSLGRAAFVNAEELALGDELCLADGRRATVSAARREDASDGQPFRTYNLSVDEGRTYFAGRLGAWVHNTGAGWETTCKLVAVQVRKQVDANPNLTDDEVLQRIEEAIKRHGGAGADADAFTRKKHLRDVVEYLTNPADPDNPAFPDRRRESLLEAIDERFDSKNDAIPWIPPLGLNGPSAKYGRWAGDRLNSGWYDNRPEVQRITKGEPIPFVEGRIVFDKWVTTEFNVSGVKGGRANRNADTKLIYKAIFEREALSAPGEAYSQFKHEKMVTQWLDKQPDGFGGRGLSPHHAGGEKIQYVPKDLHRVQHTAVDAYRPPGQ